MDRRSWGLAIASAALIACSSTNSDAPSAQDAGSADDSAGLGATTVVQTVGVSGGTVAAAGVVLTIPAGALPADTQVTIDSNAGPAPSGFAALTPLLAIGPAGMVLQEPATIEFSLSTSGTQPVIFWSNGSSGFDPLATTSTPTTASATITQLGEGFVGDEKKVHLDAGIVDATAPVDATDTVDATTTNDSGATEDSGPIDAAETTDGGVKDAGGVTDASSADSGAIEDSGPVDAGVTTDSGVTDASTTDSGALGDAGLTGFSITIDGASLPTLFATNMSVTTNGNSIWTIKADDNPSGVHWSVELQVNGLTQQAACQTIGYPLVTYTQYLNGAPVAVFTTQIAGGGCTFSFIGTPAAHGQYAHGTFNATVAESDAGAASHTLSAGSYNLLY